MLQFILCQLCLRLLLFSPTLAYIRSMLRCPSPSLHPPSAYLFLMTLQFLTTLPIGTVQLSLGSVGFNAVTYSQSSALAQFSPAAPSVLSVLGSISGIRTSGGVPASPLEVVVANAQNAAYVQISVGAALCPLLQVVNGRCSASLVAVSSSDGSGTITESDTAQAIAIQVLSPQAQGSTGSATVICCVPPPGEGAAVPIGLSIYPAVGAAPIVLIADVSANYAPPTVSAVLVSGGGSGGGGMLFTSPSVFPSVVLPTASGSVRVWGNNMGAAPLLFTGDVLAVDATTPALPSLGAPCPAGTSTPASASSSSDACFDFATPEGEGSGRHLPNGTYGAGTLGYYPFYVTATGQRSASPVWSASYAAPVVGAVVTGSSSGASGFPTRGGTPIIILGSNFGATPASRPPSTLSASLQLGANDPGAVNFTACVRLNHTAIACVLTAGAGASLSVSVTAADLSGMGVALMSYDAPNITGISLNSTGPWDAEEGEGALSSGPSLAAARGAAAGGSILRLTGVNFGAGPWWIPMPADDAAAAAAAAAAASTANSTANSSGSAGSGSGAYAAYTALYGGGTAGLGATGYCVFLSWTFRGIFNPTPLCNAMEDFIGEGELPWARVLSWDHEAITLVTPPGVGLKDVIVGARGGFSAMEPTLVGIAVPPMYTSSSTAAAAAAAGGSAPGAASRLWRWEYAPPLITAMTPSVGETAGGSVITLSGVNFGPTPLNTSIFENRLHVNASTGSLGLPLIAAPSLPTYVLLLRFGNGSSLCMSDGLDGDGGRSLGLAVAASSCGPLGVHNDSTLSFTAPPGYGSNISVVIQLLDNVNTPPFAQSNAALFSYAPPSVSSFIPNPVQLFGAPALVGITGRNFGGADAASSSGGGGDAAIAIRVGASPCVNAARVEQPTFGIVLQCQLEATTRCVCVCVCVYVCVCDAAAVTAAVGAAAAAVYVWHGTAVRVLLVCYVYVKCTRLCKICLLLACTLCSLVMLIVTIMHVCFRTDSPPA